jgi:hypothetical protein
MERGEFVVDAREYLDGLSGDGLVRALGSKANARAYLDGADPHQIWNAYRGGDSVRTAQSFIGTARYTTEGMTTRGLAYRSMAAARQTIPGFDRVCPGARLMPSTIYARADQYGWTRERTLTELEAYGWINPGGLAPFDGAAALKRLFGG